MPAACEVPTTNQIGQHCQPCPRCDGTMPADAIVVSRWKYVPGTPPAYQRTIKMHCPHCDAKRARLEFVPESFIS